MGTGIALAIPDGHAGLVLPRSGLAAKHGIALVNAPGLIDAGYRGEVRVLLLNTCRDAAFEVAPGDRIAQLVLVRHEAPELEEVPAAGRNRARGRRLRLQRRLDAGVARRQHGRPLQRGQSPSNICRYERRVSQAPAAQPGVTPPAHALRPA